MNYFFNFTVPAFVAMACAILTFLIGRHVGAAVMAGVYCGISLSLAFEFGKGGFDWRYVVTELVGGIVGGAFGGLMFLAKG